MVRRLAAGSVVLRSPGLHLIEQLLFAGAMDKPDMLHLRLRQPPPHSNYRHYSAQQVACSINIFPPLHPYFRKKPRYLIPRLAVISSGTTPFPCKFDKENKNATLCSISTAGALPAVRLTVRRGVFLAQGFRLVMGRPAIL